MSASILYHEFGMRRHRHKRCFFDDEKIVFSVEIDPAALRCPCCKAVIPEDVAKPSAGF